MVADLIGDALANIAAQTHEHWECIVVDVGSTDGTRDQIEAADGRLRYMYEEPQGPSATRNAGIADGSEPVVAFLIAGDIWLEPKLKIQLETLRTAPDIGMSCTYFDEVDGRLRPLREWAQIPAKELVLTFGACRLPGSASAALVRRTCLNRVGYFVPDLRLGEDPELWYRIALRFAVALGPQLLVPLRKFPKEPDLDRVLIDLSRMVTKFKAIAPPEHQSLVAEVEFDMRWVAYADYAWRGCFCGSRGVRRRLRSVAWAEG